MYNMNDLYKHYYDNYRQYDDVYGYMNYYNMDYNRMNPYYIKDYGAEPFVININEITKQNNNFRQVFLSAVLVDLSSYQNQSRYLHAAIYIPEKLWIFFLPGFPVRSEVHQT